MSGLNAYTGIWGKTQATHLLRRTTFGAKRADVNYLLTQTLSQAVGELLTPLATAPLPPLNNYNASYADPDVPAGQTWINAPYGTGGTANSYRRVSFKDWWISLMLNQNRTINEKMVVFWHNHFATELADYDDARFAYKHTALIRQYALGNFKLLAKAMTLDIAMLRYLNGYINTASSPDENYARELQELFCIGKGTNANYTEDDVKAAAKILTGYRINSGNYTVSPPIQPYAYFDSTRHNTTNKLFSAFYNNTTIAGQTGAAGANELDALLNMIFNNQECAKFICRRLYTFFVNYNITPQVETDIITPLAQILRNSGYEIMPVLKALLKSEHFFDAANIGCQIKTPLDLTIGLCREFEVTFPAAADIPTQYTLWDRMRTAAVALQQNIGDPPNVAGWAAFYQAPMFYDIWINSDTLPKRNQFTDLMATLGYTVNSQKIAIDPLGFTDTLSNPSDPNAIINELIQIMYPLGISQASKQQIKTDILLTGQTNDTYWTTAWQNYKQNPSNATYKTLVATRLTNLYKYFMDLSEYQLM